jgi:hypothetical protein
MTKSIGAIILATVLCPAIGHTQNKLSVFPHVADGRVGDGSYYKSTIMILPGFLFSSSSITCSLIFHGG